MENIPNWRDKNYLAFQVQHSWGHLVPDDNFENEPQKIQLLMNQIIPLSDKILNFNQALLLSDYYFPDLELDKLAEKRLYLTLYVLYARVCLKKRRLLVGVADDAPLWVPLPAFLESPGTTTNMFNWFYLASMVYPWLQFLSGATKQQVYDRLFLPAPDRWPPFDFWNKEAVVKFEESVFQGLGYKTGKLTPDDFYEVAAQISLERRYTLTDQKPILVRLREHPTIQQVWLMPKGETILAKIETNLGFDLVDFVSFDIGMWGGMYQAMSYGVEEISGCALPVLIAQIYKTLVTVEEIESSGKATSSNSVAAKPEKSSEKESSTSWQYIPRRLYLKKGGDEAVERAPLTEVEKERQRQLHHLHQVMGHKRQLGGQQKASPEKLKEAEALGIKIGDGETWVKPHYRGVEGLPEDFDIGSIPHYIYRKK